jgi:membrane-bound serine protease (ClpP class)
MKKSLRDIMLFVLCLFLIKGWVYASEPNFNNQEITNAAKAAVIVCKGDIDYGLYKSIQRRTETALNQGVQYLIFEIGTYGGLLKSADDIAKYLIINIPELDKNVHTVAYITTEAISAGALISVSCQDIIMKENTTIGDCAPISIGGQIEGVEREKVESATRAFFSRAANANGYPEALLKAMVTMQIEVYKIMNLKTNQYEFFEGDNLPADPNVYGLDNKELVDSSDEILILTAQKAYEYGISRTIVKDLKGVLDYFEERDGVEFASEPFVLKTTWSEEVARWLNSTSVMAVLVLLALLGVYIEFNTPGLGLPGLVALICFVIIVGSKYITGLANWIEVAFLFIGILLILIEFFIIPGFGIAGISGFVCLFIGLFGMLLKNPPDEIPWPNNTFEWNDFNHGVISLSLGFGGFLICAWLLSKYLPKIPYLGGLILVPDSSKKGGITRLSITKPQESETENLNIGDMGEVISTLRPTGKVKFGDAIVDVVAEGDFINKGIKVKITGIHGNRVVVKAVIK